MTTGRASVTISGVARRRRLGANAGRESPREVQGKNSGDDLGTFEDFQSDCAGQWTTVCEGFPQYRKSVGSLYCYFTRGLNVYEERRHVVHGSKQTSTCDRDADWVSNELPVQWNDKGIAPAATDSAPSTSLAIVHRVHRPLLTIQAALNTSYSQPICM